MRDSESSKIVAWGLRIGAYVSFGLLIAAAGLKIADETAAAEVIAKAGILVLLATPSVRIVTALVTFAIQRDTRMVLVSAGVLLIVLLASLGGMRLH
jgi:uncharacterized membrane protein